MVNPASWAEWSVPGYGGGLKRTTYHGGMAGDEPLDGLGPVNLETTA